MVVAMIMCKYANLDDMFNDIVEIVKATYSGDDAR